MFCFDKETLVFFIKLTQLLLDKCIWTMYWFFLSLKRQLKTIDYVIKRNNNNNKSDLLYNYVNFKHFAVNLFTHFHPESLSLNYLRAILETN